MNTHGSKSGFWKHRRAKTEPCQPCRNAWNEHVKNRRDLAKRARETTVSNAEVRKYDEALKADPPVIAWSKDRHGVMRGIVLHDPHAEQTNRKVAS